MRCLPASQSARTFLHAANPLYGPTRLHTLRARPLHPRSSKLKMSRGSSVSPGVKVATRACSVITCAATNLFAAVGLMRSKQGQTTELRVGQSVLKPEGASGRPKDRWSSCGCAPMVNAHVSAQELFHGCLDVCANKGHSVCSAAM